MRGWHWAGTLNGRMSYVNIPYWPHRIIILGVGHLTRRGRFIRWLPGVYTLHLQYCCPARRAQTEQVDLW